MRRGGESAAIGTQEADFHKRQPFLDESIHRADLDSAARCCHLIPRLISIDCLSFSLSARQLRQLCTRPLPKYSYRLSDAKKTAKTRVRNRRNASNAKAGHLCHPRVNHLSPWHSESAVYPAWTSFVRQTYQAQLRSFSWRHTVVATPTV